MKLKLQLIISAVLCGVLLHLTGCVSNNVRTAQFGNISARAHLEKGVASYYQIEINQPLSPNTPTIWLRLPDGRIIDRTWFKYPVLKQAGFESASDQDFQPSNIYTHELKRYGTSFLFNLGDLKLIRLTQIPGPEVTIGREHATEFFSLPMTQEQLEAIFGHPEKVKDSFHL